MRLIDSIKELQVKRGWSDGELSRQLGINQSQWSRIQSGKREMGLKFLHAVAVLFPEIHFPEIHQQIVDYVIKGGD